MSSSIYCYDPTVADQKSKMRGVGRYLQILKENFPAWNFSSNLKSIVSIQKSIFINPFLNFLQPPLTLKRVAQKQIAVIHDLIPLKYPDHFPVGLKGMLNIFLNKLALRHYDTIVTDSEASKSDIIRYLGLPEQRVRVIYPCLPKIFSDSNLIHETANIPESFCLYVGDATWNKNLVTLVQALKEINVTCMFVGKVFENKSLLNHPWQSEQKEFMALTHEDKRFILQGYISDEELKDLYKKSRCNILVSRDEGFGFSYLEAASQECPSILSSISVFKEISNGQGALFVKPDDKHEIANAIGEIYFRKDKRNTLGVDAKRRAEYFNAQQFKQKFNSIL